MQLLKRWLWRLFKVLVRENLRTQLKLRMVQLFQIRKLQLKLLLLHDVWTKWLLEPRYALGRQC